MIIDIFEAKEKIIFYTVYNAKLIPVLKRIGARWDARSRFWYIDKDNLCFENKDECLKIFDELIEFCNNGVLIKLQNIIEKLYQNIEIIVPEGLKLFPFQEEGVKQLLKKGRKVLLADEMGLGKTIQAIVYVNGLMKVEVVFPVILVCPMIVKLNWEKEFKKWCIKRDVKIRVISGRNDKIKRADVYIINYDILDVYIDKFEVVNGVILDECHYIKNRRAKRTKAVYKLVAKYQPKYIIALSGTPLLNRPIELWTTLNLLKPSVFGNFWKFALRYCGAYKSQWGWIFNRVTHSEELARLLKQTVMIRREKKDVLKELPEKIRVVMPIEISYEKRFNELEQKVRKIIDQLEKLQTELLEADKDKAKNIASQIKAVWSGNIGEIEEYRKEAVEKKLPFMFEFIDNCLEQENKIVAFVHHRDIWNRIIKKYRDVAVGILGGMDSKYRNEAVYEFQTNNNIRLFVGSIRACGEGITLAEASKVIFVEYDWTPARMLQAEDRLHRIGQKSIVYSYWFVLKDSIDEYFVNNIVKKIKIIEKVLEVKDKEKFVLFDFLEINDEGNIKKK